MQITSRPGFYLIFLLIAAMLFLTLWLHWKVSTPELLRKRNSAQDKAPPSVTTPP